MKKVAASDAILRVLKRGPRRGLDAVTIAERASLNLNTTRTTIGSLVNAGAVLVIGTKKTEGVGRPSNLYALAA